MSGTIEQGTNTGVVLLKEIPSKATLITSGYVYSGFSTLNSSIYDYTFSSCVNNLYPANQNSNSLAGPYGPTGTNDPIKPTSIAGGAATTDTGLIMQLFDASGFPVNDENNFPIQIQYIPNYTQDVSNSQYNNDLFMMVSYSGNSVNKTLNFKSTGSKSFLSGTQGFTVLPSYFPVQDKNTIGKSQTTILNSEVGGVLSFPATAIILAQPAGTGINYNTDNYYLYFVASNSDPNPFINGQITNSGGYDGQNGSSGYFELYYN